MKPTISLLLVLMASTFSYACATTAPGVSIEAPVGHAPDPIVRKAAKRVDLVVGLSGTRTIEDVAGALTRAGFEVDAKLDVVKMITGRDSADAIERLRKIEGVSFVEIDVPVYAQGSAT